MTYNSISNQSDIPANLLADDGIDIGQVFGALFRRKALIAKITTASILAAGLYSFIKKPIWEGQFEIVLASAQSASSQARSLLNSNPDIANVIGISGGNDELKTEVEILGSPSILKPVFDFVKQHKQQQGIDTRNLYYSDWLEKYLTIELVKGTSVLELAYRDTDKDLVLPVIQKISAAYQDYSGRNRTRGINQGIQYLDQQIEIYGKKSVISLRTAQEYGIEHNLPALQGVTASSELSQLRQKLQGNKGSVDVSENFLNIEAIRITASNQIRNIDEQIKQLDQLDNNAETLIYIGRTIPELAEGELSKQLDKVDTRLAILRTKYTDQDDSIQILIAKRRRFIELFRQQTYGYLYAQRVAAQARLKSAERPKEVSIKFRELLRTAARDEATLTKLESERQFLALEQARKEDPWELISNPTLLDEPVAPRKKFIFTLGLFAGLFAGCGAAVWVDRRTGIIYNEEELKSLMPCPLIKHIPATGVNEWSDAADLLAAGPLSKAPGNSDIALIPVGNIPKVQLQAFSTDRQYSRQALVNRLRQTSRCATQLLVTSQGVTTAQNFHNYAKVGSSR